MDFDLRKITLTQVFLYLGSLIIFISGVWYIFLNWHQWTSSARVLAILIPMLLMFSLGELLKREVKTAGHALTFTFTGGLIFPLWLIITFREYQLFGDPLSTNFGFAVALLSLLAYIALRFVYPSQVWVFLYCAVGAVAWYLFLRLLGVPAPIKDMTIVWMMFPLVVFYILLGAYHELAGRRPFGKYAYLFAFALLLVTLNALTITGDLLKPVLGSGFHNISLWSGIVSGVILLILSLVSEWVKKFGLSEPANLAGPLNLLGTLSVLSAVFQLGLVGRQPVYETLLLLLSLGFIFTSTMRLSKSFLYLGTIYLVVYIFEVGSKYFQNQIGWPLTLLLAGLLSMGVGLGMDQLRRRYFKSNKQ